jgi:mannobiose 2-epimerase
MDSARIRTCIDRAEAELSRNILPFWIEHAVDQERGGFYGEITNDLSVDRNASKGALLCSRILWTYSAAYRRYHDPAYLEMAHWAYDDLAAHFWDEQYGGLYWEVDAEGRAINTRKQIYGQAFGIYGLSEYYRATGNAAALHKAIAILGAIEQYAYDPVHGGYLEAFTRDWRLAQDLRLSDVDMNEKKSMNTHLHIMEAYANLMRAWNDAELRSKQAELLELMMTRIIDPRTHHTILFFDEYWNCKSDHVSYGHDIEASWLLVESADVLGDADLIEAASALAVPMAQATLDEGIDPDGGMVYEATPKGIVQPNKEWWPQAEAVVGFINAYQLSSKAHFMEAALKSWDFIEAYLVDRTYGEWFRYVTRDGAVGMDEPKVSFWKCPYHNGRACLETIERLSYLTDRDNRVK